jgi:hypothetical protein
MVFWGLARPGFRIFEIDVGGASSRRRKAYVSRAKIFGLEIHN